MRTLMRGNKAVAAALNSQHMFSQSLYPMRLFGSTIQPVPTMGDSISEGVIEEFVKNVGEFVEADEIVARIETDKVTVDILSTHSGVIKKYF
jgi:predicted deacylase